MSATYTRDCPNFEECGGELDFFEETAEDYTNNGFSVWSYSYLLMSDPGTCSAGCTFTPAEQEQIEKDATEAYVDRSWMEP